ncbi:hypothetical protein HG531_003860 [Fusarium graminearum]|nr:hypothetical protein HG531_003860 [Fusarium graminearum]
MTSPHLATYMATSAYLVRFWSTITSGTVTTELVTVETIIPAVAPYYEACGLKALLSKSNGGNGVILTINGNLAYLPNTYTDANTLGGYNYCVEYSFIERGIKTLLHDLGLESPPNSWKKNTFLPSWNVAYSTVFPLQNSSSEKHKGVSKILNMNPVPVRSLIQLEPMSVLNNVAHYDWYNDALLVEESFTSPKDHWRIEADSLHTSLFSCCQDTNLSGSLRIRLSHVF